MIGTNLAGMRCWATNELRSHQGRVKRLTEGTIHHDLNNLGQHLISVQWDSGVTDYVFPLEIEIIYGQEELISSHA